MMVRLRVRKSVPLPGPFYISSSKKKRKVHRSEDEQMATTALMVILVPGCFLAAFLLVVGLAWVALVAWVISIVLGVKAFIAVSRGEDNQEQDQK